MIEKRLPQSCYLILSRGLCYYFKESFVIKLCEDVYAHISLFPAMEFNDLQKKIIENINGAYLISAPVGTGKTTVLIERVIKALEKGFKPEEILCLTFTNRASEEILERLKKRSKKKEINDAVTINTFHGFCAHFVKAEAKNIGINPDFVIFDETEQTEILKAILENYPEIMPFGKNEQNEIRTLIDKLYNYRLEALEKKIGCNVREEEISDELSEVNEKYLNSLKEQNALDFNEMVLLTIKTLYLDEKIRNKWAKKYKFIQLDEFQDTHLSEYLVVKELAKEYKNIALIGDLDQTIYGWRGSEPFFIADLFRTHFAPVTEFNLEINYRSNKNTLDAVKSFLTSFANPTTKNIECLEEGKGEKCVEVFGAYNLSEEIDWVVKSIKNCGENERIAVLARTNTMINQIANVFSAKGIAHITVDKYDFFKRQEVKDIFAYLKIIFNKFDLESATRITQRPARNIGLATLKKIREEGNPLGLRISDFLSFRNYNFKEPFANLIQKFKNGRIVVLDTETTGINVLKDEIIQIYAIEIINGEMGNEFHFYLKNTIPVGNSSDVHGLTDEFLKTEGREPKEVLEELKEFIKSDVVAGHNINFDLSMVLENGKRKNVLFEFKEYYDTLDISRRLIEAENYKLTTLSSLLGLKAATHDAKDDVWATFDLLRILIEKLQSEQKKRIELFKKFSHKFIQVGNLIESWKKAINEKRPHEALEYIWETSGLKTYYESDTEKEKRFKSIETLVNLFKEKDDPDRASEIMIRELIHYSALVKDINFLGLEKGKIPVVTVHQVKGLEFDHVFIIGANEFKFPMYQSDLEEEKRLFYVALTRAKKNIYISYSNFNDYNKPINRSPFIDFIDRKYINFLS